MNQKRKKVRLDDIKQKENSESESGKKHHRHLKSSGGQSDFSEFELEPKDINNDFKEFKKPKLWDKLIKNNIKTQKHQKNKQKRPKIIEGNQETDRKNKKQAKPQNNIQELISFKKNNPADLVPSSRQASASKSKRNAKQNRDESEQLIKEYDKSQFNNKVQQKEIEAGYRTLERSRKEDRQQQIKNKGMVETAGGICFDVTLTGFAFKDDQKIKPKKSINPSRKGSKTGFGKRKKSSVIVPNDILQKQEILRRRHIAFLYGEIARRKTFGYY